MGRQDTEGNENKQQGSEGTLRQNALSFPCHGMQGPLLLAAGDGGWGWGSPSHILKANLKQKLPMMLLHSLLPVFPVQGPASGVSGKPRRLSCPFINVIKRNVV